MNFFSHSLLWRLYFFQFWSKVSIGHHQEAPNGCVTLKCSITNPNKKFITGKLCTPTTSSSFTIKGKVSWDFFLQQDWSFITPATRHILQGVATTSKHHQRDVQVFDELDTLPVNAETPKCIHIMSGSQASKGVSYPWPLTLRLKQPSLSLPRESAPHCKKVRDKWTHFNAVLEWSRCLK